MDWYNEYIEEPIRDIVHGLRDYGINTECSCGHQMYVQCAYFDKDEMLNRVYNVMCSLNVKNYQILLHETIRDGYRFAWFDVMLPDKNGIYSSEIKWNDDFIENKF
jgi:hypothetical protein